MKKCKECGIEKELVRFKPLKKSKYYSNQCKDCRNVKLRTGKLNTGRFKKGVLSTPTPFLKGNIPHNKGIFWGNSRSTKLNCIWKNLVKQRDGNKCVKCGVQEWLTCHHIKPWKAYPELRFDVNNGMTLCRVCHGKEEGPLNAKNGINSRFKNGHVFSYETIKKISEKLKGRTPYNKGKKLSSQHVEKLKISHLGKVPWNKGTKGLMPPAWNKGQKASEEIKIKLYEANIKTWEKRKKEGLPGPRIGTKASDEQKRKVSESLKKAYAEGRRKKRSF